MKSKFIKILLVIFISLSLVLINIKNIEADSGWDSSYDSGGSWDSGSDWGSSSSWDNDYDYDYDYDNDSNYGSSVVHVSCTTLECKIDALLTFLFFILAVCSPFILVGILEAKKRTMKRKKHKEILNMFVGLSNEKANSIMPNFNIEEFNFKAYQIFYDVQMAWMEFDYDKLKELLTDELYNSYVMQLDALKVKSHKNIMKGFELVNTALTDLREENGLYIAEVSLNVRFYDYVESTKTGIVLRGTPSRKLNNIYKLTFIKTTSESTNINNCPRCGAPVEGNSTGVCEYCKSKLINDNYDWVMSKKEKINQR